jgi:predicted transcriptional regulator
MSSGSDEKRQVQFRAPQGLVERTDVLATVLETDRTDVIISALREYLRDAAHDDELEQEIAEAYYDDDVSFEQLKALVGHEEAADFHVLKTQLSDEFLKDAEEELADR